MFITFLTGLIAFLHLWTSPVAPAAAAPSAVPAAVGAAVEVEVVQPEVAPEPEAQAPVYAEDGSLIENPDFYYDPCSPVVLEEGTDYWYLTDGGWTSRNDDGMEALYPPGC